jgi:hypothetical protein
VIDGIPGGKESPQGYRHYLDVVRKQRPPAGTDQAGLDAWAARVLAAHGQFQLLCALRAGRGASRASTGASPAGCTRRA